MKIFMASKRNTRRRQCQGKVKHKTWGDACVALRVSKQTGRFPGHLRAYLCPNCGQYHIGHTGNHSALADSGLYSKREFKTK